MLDKLFFRCFFLVCMFVSSMSTDPGCSEPLSEGEGDGHELRYFFDPNINYCRPFFYKGQGGSSNNFDSDKSCTMACLDGAQSLYPEGAEVCSLPVDHGTCMAMHLKYHFDPELKVCRLFHYGGCQGNGNRFDTKKDCMDVCKARSGRTGAGSGDPDVDPDINPDASSVSAGLIVGVLGAVVFAVAVVAAIALAVVQRNDRKRVPTKEVEMNDMS